jgi:SAM-dependent methyltransferase
VAGALDRGYSRRVPDALFAHHRLAPIYDAFEGDRDDLTAYLSIADELSVSRVLDIGCGTGCLVILLAEGGRTVVGVDPAEASLEFAKSKDRTGRITWVHGDATTLPALGADLALMTGNVAQVFLTDDDWMQTLQGIHTALRSRGYFAFETRRPERRIWEEWIADSAQVTMEVPGIGLVERGPLEVTEVSLPFVTFRYTYRFLLDGVVVTSDSTLRFRGRDEVESSLFAGGYRVLDVRDAPDRPGREFVFIAERAT